MDIHKVISRLMISEYDPGTSSPCPFPLPSPPPPGALINLINLAL